ncbi:MAG: SDR family oxidoreductase [Clostridia bacterium]|jgi:gluconate 5-dehydrogenase
MENLFNLSDKLILVTGGAGHLGSAICEGLALYGATVIIASRDYDKCNLLANDLAKKYHSKCAGIAMDITNFVDVEQKIKNIANEYGSIDVLINNAYSGTSGFLEDFTDELWNKGIDGSINSTYRVTRAVLPYMKKQHKGSIINIASMYGVVAPNPKLYKDDASLNNPANYGVGKAAIIQFTKYIAAYYAKFGIRANAISPGAFPNLKVQQNKQFIKRLSEKSMIGRIGQPHELQGIVILLATDASSYITGQNICVDGGWTAW